MFPIKPVEYAWLQLRFTEMLKEEIPTLTNLSPLDSTTLTRFIDLPVAEASVPSGYFLTDSAQVRFSRDDTATPNGNCGFRSVVRVEI